MGLLDEDGPLKLLVMTTVGITAMYAVSART